METLEASARETAAPTNPQEWMAYFRQLVEKIVTDDHLTEVAVAAIADACTHGVSENDSPAQAIASIIEAHRRTKIEAMKILSEFVLVCGGDVAASRTKA